MNSCFTRFTDIKKKFDSVDLNENKFKNKGSFYNRFPASPESPSPPPSIPSSQITPETTPSKPAAAPSPVQPWVKPAASPSVAKSSVSTPDPVSSCSVMLSNAEHVCHWVLIGYLV